MSIHLTSEYGRCQWNENDLMLEISDPVDSIQAGSRMRTIPCVACHAPIGSSSMRILFVAMGRLCPNDMQHLAGLALLVHDSCDLPDDEMVLDRLKTIAEIETP